jgi:hypothetical protein
MRRRSPAASFSIRTAASYTVTAAATGTDPRIDGDAPRRPRLFAGLHVPDRHPGPELGQTLRPEDTESPVTSLAAARFTEADLPVLWAIALHALASDAARPIAFPAREHTLVALGAASMRTDPTAESA